MKITLICVGKIKAHYFKDAIDEYRKRLSRYCNLEIIEVQDEKTPDNASESENVLIKQRESERIHKKIKDNAYVIALEIKGKARTSEGFAKMIDNLLVGGTSHIVFIIGGSLGLAESVLSRADESLSFSLMTFPHQMMRVILLEQIYRAHKILQNEPYHK